MKYTIKVFPTDPATTDLDASYTVEGIECDGFTIITDSGDGTWFCNENMSVTDIAQCIATDDTGIAAAHIAIGMANAYQAIKSQKEKKMLARLIDRLNDDHK